MAKPSSRELILDTAERLFAEQGLDAVSLRAINAEAGLSPAALHYHFRTREGLVQAILERRMRPWSETEQLFFELEAQAQPSVRDVIACFIDSPAKVILEHGEGGRRYMQLVAHIYLVQHPIIEQLLIDRFQLTARRIFCLICKALPDHPVELLKMRHAVVVQSGLQALANMEQLSQPYQLKSPPPPLKPEQFIEQLIDFLAAGVAAPFAPDHIAD